MFDKLITLAANYSIYEDSPFAVCPIIMYVNKKFSGAVSDNGLVVMSMFEYLIINAASYSITKVSPLAVCPSFYINKI